MSPRLDDIYKILLEQSQDIGHIKAKVESIDEQVKKTNGRVTALETEDTNQKINWARVSWVGTLIGIVAIALVNMAIDFIKNKLS
jgi:tetrahydromethanopterin S-methyltransferase subunit G